MRNNIKNIIECNGLKIVYVIEKSSLSKSAFYDIMNGKSIPSLVNARRISEVLGHALEEVFPNETFTNENNE
ncbi:MAG: XRE family transcriptional regulator [Clostridium sp.]